MKLRIASLGRDMCRTGQTGRTSSVHPCHRWIIVSAKVRPGPMTDAGRRPMRGRVLAHGAQFGRSAVGQGGSVGLRRAANLVIEPVLPARITILLAREASIGRRGVLVVPTLECRLDDCAVPE